MNKLSVFVMVIIVSALITPFIFASTSIITPADSSQNNYYVSNYSTREISFSVNYDFKSEELKDGKIVYSYKVLPNSEGLDIQLSNTEILFTNNFSNTETIYLNTKQLTEIKNLQIKSEVFDIYNNLLFTKVLYLKIIPNNSNNYYEYTKTHSEPRYAGYSISRTIAVINGLKDYDIISIYTKTEDNSPLALSCFTSNQAIVVEQQYQSPERTDIKLAIDSKAKDLKSGDYYISCKLFNAYVSQELPEIKLRYTSYNISKETEDNQNQSVSITETAKSVTGFLSFSKAKSSNFTYVLFIILIILILLILFSRNSS
ncbi:MAG TPA: hypothetical protein PLK55_04025 [archaeon]|jgi:hypothetical protein|nr:hypothetical protein [archaeon]